MTLSSEEIRKRFLTFFEKRNHTIIPSASLIPQNDPSVLFTTAGMQPLVPYLLGKKHPEGKRLANYQRCIRTNDIDEVGDATHLTFFEMLGNWSLGDYFKEDAIQWSYKLLTDSTEGFGLDPKRLFITVFAGNKSVSVDDTSVEIWRSLGIPESRIFYLSDNWWPNPKENSEGSGPCGPDTEMFYDLTPDGLGDNVNQKEFEDADSRGDIVEIWNDVFMEYKKENGIIVGSLEHKNVDTGSGLERLTAVLQGKQTVFETDLFEPIISSIYSQETKDNIDNDALHSRRIIADHIRASVFIIHDGIEPSNSEAGYVLRRLLRRAILRADQLGIPEGSIGKEVVSSIITKYGQMYTSLIDTADYIQDIVITEERKFRNTLTDAMKVFKQIIENTSVISGDQAFLLFSTYGMPIELIQELSAKYGITVNADEFAKAYKDHQEKSKAGAKQKFKGGLAGSGSDMEVKYHTATHLLNASLKHVLGDHVRQKGSNITDKRLRFDFSHSEKLTEDEKQNIEELINTKISEDLPVTSKEMDLEDAYASGATGVFGEDYSDTVTVYTIGDTTHSNVFSKEICGGPHVTSTGQLNGTFHITKEESVSAGVRRIKAVLE